MKIIEGKCEFYFEFPHDERFKGMASKQKIEHFKKSISGILRKWGNMEVNRVRVKLDEKST